MFAHVSAQAIAEAASMKVPLCKTCGHPIIADEVGIVLTPLQRRIFNIVKAAGTAGLTARDIVEMVYSNDPAGGPISPNVISVVCNQMNKRLAQFSLAVKGTPHRGGFTLQRLQSGRWINAKDK